MIRAEISTMKSTKKSSDSMLDDEFEIRLTEEVNGNWLADLINKALEDYEERNKPDMGRMGSDICSDDVL